MNIHNPSPVAAAIQTFLLLSIDFRNVLVLNFFSFKTVGRLLLGYFWCHFYAQYKFPDNSVCSWVIYRGWKKRCWLYSSIAAHAKEVSRIAATKKYILINIPVFFLGKHIKNPTTNWRMDWRKKWVQKAFFFAPFPPVDLYLISEK